MAMLLASRQSKRSHLEALGLAWMSFWVNGCLDGFEQVHSSKFIDRTPTGRKDDLAGFRSSVIDLYKAFPDFSARILFMAVDEVSGIITLRWAATGTHLGSFMGISATKRTIPFEGIDVIRCIDGKVVERWGEWNGLEILRALGTPLSEDMVSLTSHKACAD